METAKKTRFPNRYFSARLDEYADRMTLAGAPRFRTASFRKAARAIRHQGTALEISAESGTLRDIEGVGQGTEAILKEIIETGTFSDLEALRKDVPDALLALSKLPGIGTKTAHAIWTLAGSPATLEDVIAFSRTNDLKGVKGIKKSTAELLSNFDIDEDMPDLYSDAGPPVWIRSFAAQAGNDACKAIGPAACATGGALAAGAERVDAVEIIVNLSLLGDRKSPDESLHQEGWIREANGHWMAPNGAKVVIHECTDTVEAIDCWSNTLTGDNKDQALPPVPETAKFEPGRLILDEQRWHAAGMHPIPAEARWREDLIELATSTEDVFENLINANAIKGELHCHSTWSDGESTIAQMVDAARNNGDSYIAITDHSAPYALVNGLDHARLKEQAQEIKALNSGLAGEFTVLQGSEVEVLADGSLGLNDSVLKELDWVVASWHVSQRQDEETMWKRVERVVRNPLVDAIGHPTARLLGVRPPVALNVERLIELCAETGTLIEINSTPYRLDLNAEHARMAADAGVPIVINTDAHIAEDLSDRMHGVAIARRAGLAIESVANTRTLNDLENMRPRNRVM